MKTTSSIVTKMLFGSVSLCVIAFGFAFAVPSIGLRTHQMLIGLGEFALAFGTFTALAWAIVERQMPAKKTSSVRTFSSGNPKHKRTTHSHPVVKKGFTSTAQKMQVEKMVSA